MVRKSSTENNSDEIKYTGVRKRKWGKWVSEIRLPNSRERIWLGSYDSPQKAARAFDAAQFCLRGKSANFNFPNNPPDIAGGRSMTPSEIQTAAARFANMITDEDENEVVGSGDDQIMDENNLTVEEYSLFYSPSISDGTTVEMDSFELRGVETSFQQHLSSLSNTIGSGNYASDFGYFTGFDDFTVGEFYPPPQPDNFDYGAQQSQDDIYNASLYQNSYLWNF